MKFASHIDDLSSERAALLKAVANVDPKSFETLALRLFRYQARYNPVYAHFLTLLSCKARQIRALTQIPFLPVSLFKQYTIKTGHWPDQVVFKSSGTTGQQSSSHHIRSADWYSQNSRRAFEKLYGPVENYCFLALLPSYLERSDASLVFMAKQFIDRSKYAESGFFLHHRQRLLEKLHSCKRLRIPTILLGVSFALLELAETNPVDLAGIIVMETGGMKGRREEMTRGDLHSQLKAAFNLEHVHSEYGMTELLSQAYASRAGRFVAAPAMKVIARDISDPFAEAAKGRIGTLNVIDLANLDSCAFIATDDLGRVQADGSFEVLGRLDHSELRGCNLMVS